MGEKLPLGDISYRSYFGPRAVHNFTLEEIKYETWKKVLWVKRKVKYEDNSSAAEFSLKYNFLHDTSNRKSGRKISRLENYETCLDFEQKLYALVVNPDTTSNQIPIFSAFKGSSLFNSNIWNWKISRSSGLADSIITMNVWLFTLATPVMKHSNGAVRHWALESLGARTVLQSRK